MNIEDVQRVLADSENFKSGIDDKGHVMAKSSNQKGKILYLEHYLHGTGENHVVTMQDILTFLSEKGIRAERKSIYDDLEVLREFGMDIRYRRGRPGGYYVANGTGSTSEDPPEEPVPMPAPERYPDETPAGPEPQAEEAPEKNSVNELPGPLSHVLFGPEEEYRQVRLQCPEMLVDEIRRVFGPDVEIRQRMGDDVLIAVSAPDSPAFYGWLTAMGTQVHLVKPRKMTQTFREYLKTLAREYKFS